MTDLGSLLAAQGMKLTLDADELVESAVLIVKVIDSDGDACIRTAWPPGMDWITRRGLIEVARDVERLPSRNGDDE